MSDLRCVVYGEPWEAWAVNHGSMLRWQAKLFRAGAGCPSCEGESPFEPLGDMERLAGQEDPQMSFLRDRLLINPAEDGSPEIIEALETGSRPRWEAPEPKKLWSCAGCEVSVVRDPDTDYPDGPVHGVEGGELCWVGGRRVHYSGGYSRTYGSGYRDEDPEEAAPHKIEDQAYCPGCAEACPDCDRTAIFRRIELEGGCTHYPGAGFLIDEGDYNARSVCYGCYEEWGFEQGEE